MCAGAAPALRGRACRDARRRDHTGCPSRCAGRRLRPSRPRSSAALGIVMACIAAWHEGQARTRQPRADLRRRRSLGPDRHGGNGRVLPAVVEARPRLGVQNILVVHRVSDLRAAGDAGSRVAQIAEGLVSESEICVLLRQAHADLAATRERLGLSDAEAEVVTRLPRGLRPVARRQPQLRGRACHLRRRTRAHRHRPCDAAARRAR